MRTATATKELLAPRAEVWSFVSQAGRLPDWWPGIFAAQDNGSTWTIEGDERAWLSKVADRGDNERQESLAVEKDAPGELRLHFDRSEYDVRLSLGELAPNRTQASLTITAPLTVLHETTHETLAERLEEVVGGVALAGPDDSFAASILEKLYDVCQTGAG